MGARAILRRNGARLVKSDLLPAGAKMRGSNLTPNKAAQYSSTGAGSYQVWSEAWDFWDPAWFQQCIDNCAVMGINVLRMQGTVYGIYSGRVTRERYLSEWKMLHDMCQKANIWLYPCGCDGGINDHFSDIPFATLMTELTAWAAFMDTLPGVFALDIIQESTFYVSANAITLYNSLKSVTKKPLTYSTNTGSASAGARTDRSDFLDFHNYGNSASTFFQNFWVSDTRPVVIGEFGSTSNKGITGQGDYYGNAIRIHRSVGALGQRVAGTLNWSVTDIDENTGNQWGIYNLSILPRWWLVSAMQRLAKTNEVVAPLAPIVSPTVTNTLLRDFDPQTITNAIHGSPVVTLPDNSGNAGDLTQSNSINRPLFQENVTPNGKPGLRFYGSTISLTNTTGGTTLYPGLTIFHVVSEISYAANYSRIFAAAPGSGSDSGSTGVATSINTTNNADFSQLSVAYDGTEHPFTKPTQTFGGWVVVAYVIPSDGTSVQIYANGTLIGSSTGTSFLKSLELVALGRAITNGSITGTTSSMFLARTLVYSGVLSATDRTTITSFLRTTYGI